MNMISVENVTVSGFEMAIRGMRNPMNSWDKSDTSFDCLIDGVPEFGIGANDLCLMQHLYQSGPSHRKFMRMVHVQMDITCHQVWWAEFDTYKVGTVRNSCSKMHKIHVKKFDRDDFSHEGIDEVGSYAQVHFWDTLDLLEWLRSMFNETQDRKYWRAMVELLPSGYNLRATVDFSYETAANIIDQRENHKVFEWPEFCCELLKLPYLGEIMRR